MTQYQPYHHFLLRSALLSSEEIKDIKSIKTAPPLALKALELGVPDFYKKLLADKNGRLNATMFRYLLRMATRVQSYSIFSAISLGQLSEITEFELDRRENATAVFNHDFVKVMDKYLELTPDKIIKNNIKVCFNPTLIKKGSLIQYLALHRNQEGTLQYSVRKLKTSLTTDLITQKTAQGISTKQLCKLLTPFYIKKLLELQLLVPCNITEKKREVKIKLQDLSKYIPSSSKVAHLYRPTKKCTLDKKSAYVIIRGAEVLFGLISHQTAKLRANSDFSFFTRLFQEKHGRREVPLLEVALWFCSPQVKDRIPEIKGISNFDKELLKICIKHDAFKTQKLHLNDDDVETLRSADRTCFEKGMEMPNCISISAQLLKNNEIYYNHILGPPSARHFARFASKNTEIYQAVKGMVKREKAYYQDQILAEISCPPAGISLGNVATKEQFYNYSILISEIGKPSAVHTLNLSDLRVSYWDFKLRIRSASLNKEVIPVLNNLYYAQHDANPIFAFLYQILTQSSFNILSWNWGGLSGLDFLPRLSYKNFIFSAAAWRLSSQDVLALKRKGNSFKEWRSLLLKKSIPQQICLQDFDKILVFDLRVDEHLTAFIDGLKSEKDNFLYEALQNPFQGKTLMTYSPEGQTFSDIILPCFKKEYTPKKTSLNNFHFKASQNEIPFSSRNKGFEQGCVYIKTYGQPEDLFSYTTKQLPQFIESLKFKKLIKNWFFINYVDEGTHLRLRFFSPSKKLPTTLLKVVDAEFKELLRNGLIQKYVYDNYEPEIERYGGIHGIGIFEKIFSIDSEYILKWHQSAYKSERLFFTLLSIDKMLDDFSVTIEDRIHYLKLIPDFHFDLSLMNEELKLFRKFRNKIIFPSHEQNEVCSLLKARSLELRPHFNKIRQLIKAQKLGVGVKGLVNSIIHMHLNRLNYFSIHEEELIKYLLVKVYFARKSVSTISATCS